MSQPVSTHDCSEWPGRAVVAIRGAMSNQERAKILLEAPMLLLAGFPAAFYASCEAAGFDDGIAYLDALRNALSSARVFGEFGSMGLNGALSKLRYLVQEGA